MRGNRSGYTLIEMLTTVAVLIIVLGLMVSLARHVRERAAVGLTKDLLRQLDQAMARYADRHDHKLPAASPFPGPLLGSVAAGKRTELADLDQIPNERDSAVRLVLSDAALANSRDFVAALRAEESSSRQGPARGGISELLGSLPVSLFDDVVLRDAWGSPIVFMAGKHPWVGTAPQDRFFFFSAGPDRQFLTQDDNLYSYEDVGAGSRSQR